MAPTRGKITFFPNAKEFFFISYLGGLEGVRVLILIFVKENQTLENEKNALRSSKFSETQ